MKIAIAEFYEFYRWPQSFRKLIYAIFMKYEKKEREIEGSNEINFT